MPSLTDLAPRTELTDEDVEWLHLLLADWQLLADLSFADLVLWLPVQRRRGASLRRRRCGRRPGRRRYHDDLVGTVAPRGRRPQLDAAYDEQRICRERDPDWPGDVPVREETIPVAAGRAGCSPSSAGTPTSRPLGRRAGWSSPTCAPPTTWP